jgi:AraC-like DNA-binding protein
MHERALIRLFRKETGDTPMAWLRARRIALACELLHHGERKIDDIAAAVGFCDRYHFTKTFTRLREMSPGAFRAMQRGK